MVTDSTDGGGTSPTPSDDADAGSSTTAAGQRTQLAQGNGQPAVVAHQVAQAGDQSPLLAMLPQAGEWVIIKVEPGSAVQLPVDLAQFSGHEVNGNLELTLPNGGVVVLEGFVAAAGSGTPPELLTAEGKPIDLAEFLVAVGVAPEALHVQPQPPPPPTDHSGHFTEGPGPQILGGLTPGGALAGTDLTFAGAAEVKKESQEIPKHEAPQEPRNLQFSVTDATVSEGQTAVFTVSYTGDTLAPGQTATIHVQTGPGFTTSFPDATSGADFTPVGFDLTFTGGQPASQTVGVTTIDDTVVEPSEDYTLVLSAPSQGTILVGTGNGVILDNDGSNLHWSIAADSTVTEGAPATYTVGYTGATLATGVTETITVATGAGWTSGFSDATSGADYTAINTVLTFTGGGSATQTVTVGTVNDTIVEGPEDYTIAISGASQGSITTPQANGVILDDNDGSRLNWSITADSTVAEGASATYTVGYTGATLAAGVTETITVATGAGWTSGFSDANNPADYTGVNTVLTFTGGGSTTQTVSVSTVDDTIVEGPEDYTISISGASAGSIVAPASNGVILDNDGSRLNWSITADSTVTEGTAATYTVGYTGAPLATGITETITVATGTGWTSGFSDATNPADYTGVNTVLTFTGGGSTTQTVSVSTIDDTIVEGPEDYTISISGASAGSIVQPTSNGVILDNDGSRLNWSITADSAVTEGAAATYTVGYTGAPLAMGVTETITVATGTGWTSGFSDATNPADYTGVNTVLTFTGGGSTTRTVSVGTIDDTIVEGPEDYTISISGASAGSIAVPTSNGVILDKDGSRLNWSITADSTVTEGTAATYTVGYTGAPLAAGMAETQDVYVDDERKITEEIRVSWNSVMTSHENVVVLQKTVQANIQTRDAYIKQFDIGQRGLLDLLNEDNELYLSKDNLVTATFAETFARFRLLAVSGGLEQALSVTPPDQAALPVDQ